MYYDKLHDSNRDACPLSHPGEQSTVLSISIQSLYKAYFQFYYKLLQNPPESQWQIIRNAQGSIQSDTMWKGLGLTKRLHFPNDTSHQNCRNKFKRSKLNASCHIPSFV